MSLPTISPSHRDLLETPHTVVLATVGPDGTPQVTAVWAMLDGDVVRTSLLTSRQKYRNLAARPQATVFVMDPANPYRTLEVRGDVELGDDPGLEFMDRIVRFYGMDPATFPAPREGRVLLTLRPRHVVEAG
jgi:PPOX class probable F420-dependent enzyme